MNYWRGYMDWPLDPDWKCPTCDTNVGLEWGMIHAQCRCNQCHGQFTMRKNDEARTIVTRPISELREEYKEPARQLWQKYHTPEDEWTDVQWDEVVKVAEV